MADAEQLGEISTEVDVDPGGEEVKTEIESEVVEEFDIVLADEDAEQKPEPKSQSDHILNRVMRKKEKLQDENVQLRQQLDQARLQPVQQATQVQPEPDEYAFDNREDYLQAKANWQQQMFGSEIDNRLNQQQNSHRIAAGNQQRDAALKTYAETAAALTVSDFNDAQDKAFDVLGEDMAQMIATRLPTKAPKLMYWLGKNPIEAERVAQMYKDDPGAATFELGELAGKLTLKPKQTNAAQPEAKIESGAVGGLNEDWQGLLDKADAEADMSNISKSINKRREIKAQAKKAGFDVSTLR